MCMCIVWAPSVDLLALGVGVGAWAAGEFGDLGQSFSRGLIKCRPLLHLIMLVCLSWWWCGGCLVLIVFVLAYGQGRWGGRREEGGEERREEFAVTIFPSHLDHHRKGRRSRHKRKGRE